MALREFRDTKGVEWLAWDVPPVRTYSRERSGRERRVRTIEGYSPDRRVADRRRRRTATGLERGWLCFQCENEKRRLAPTPANWDQAPDDELESLLASARPAPPAR